MSTIKFYRDQEAAARHEAGEAVLPGVRERCMRSAAAWQAMADRQEGFEVQKARNLALREVAEAAG